MIKTLCVIGVGVMGGSLAMSLRKHNWCQNVIGVDSDQFAIDQAIKLKVIDAGYTSIEDCPVVPDVVVIAVPVLRASAVFVEIKSWQSKCQAITDVCSTKQNVINSFHQVFGDQESTCFVPGHPIAGREKNGVSAAKHDLYKDRKVILTPLSITTQDSLNIVKQMWHATGAHVEQLDAQEHDQILAATSHLPHALAFSLVHCLSTQSHTDEIFRYAAGGFADFTRIASSDPIVWREICLANRHELLAALEHFGTSLSLLQTSLQNADGDVLEEIFTQAKNARDKYSKC